MLDDLDRLKEEYGADIIEQIEQIEQQGWRTVIDIDEITKNINKELSDRLERKALIKKFSKPQIRTRIGNIVV